VRTVANLLTGLVALEHVGIALPDQAAALRQQLGLAHLRAGEHPGEARRIGDRDGDDAVGLAGGVRELEAGRRRDFDVHGHAAQVLERHPEKGGPARAEQELVDGVREKSIGRVGDARGDAGDALGVVARLEALAPRRELCQPAERGNAIERHDSRVALEALEHVRVRQEEERSERLLGDAERAGARPDPHGLLAGLEGDLPGGAGAAEEQAVVVEGQRQARQFRRPMRRWSSLRAAV